MKKIRLLLVDDHEIVRQGLKTLLDGYEDIEVVAEARNGIEAIQQAILVRPDVTLMDITMPEMDGFEATKRIKAQCPKCEVLALTVHEDRQFLLRMLSAGALGYVTKRSLADDVVSGIRAVAGGEAFLTPKFSRMLIDNFRNNWKSVNFENVNDAEAELKSLDIPKLTLREKQVVKLVADGCKSIEIGEQLGITTRTVSRHRARIMEKLGIQSTAELVKFSIRNGLAEL